MTVTHLECSLTGERYDAGKIHNLSRAGRPLLVRYDMAAARATLTRDSLAARPPGMWKWSELLPLPAGVEPVSLGEGETPILPLSSLGPNVLLKDEGRLPTGSFKARGLAMAVSMARHFGVTRIALPTNGNAGAALAAYGARSDLQTVIICPPKLPSSTSARPPLMARRSTSPTARSTNAARSSARAPRQACGSTARRSRSRIASRARR